MSVSSHPAQKSPLLNDKTYNVLKHVASTGLPALGTLYFGLSQIWHLPDTTEVVATIAAVNTALGALLGYSTVTYNNSDTKYAGVIEVAEDEAKKVFSLNLHQAPEELQKMTIATFKVASAAPSNFNVGPVEQPAPSGFAEPQNPPTFGN
jgi:hypothetical protein